MTAACVDVAAAVAVVGRGAAGVVLEERVGDPDGRLADVDGGEGGEAALDGDVAAGVEDAGVVDAALGGGAEIEAAPIARRRRLPLAVVGGVEGAAGAVGVVLQRGEDDGIGGGALGDELGAEADLDPRAESLTTAPGSIVSRPADSRLLAA